MATEDPIIGVLIVEDDLAAAEALAPHVDRSRASPWRGTCRPARRRCVEAAGGVDLVLLDIYLPDISGLEVLRRLRAAGRTVDVVAMTRARDLSVVQAAVSFGVALYLVKPFTYSSVRRSSSDTGLPSIEAGPALLLAQQEIDKLLGGLRAAVERGGLPKGISRESLQAVVAACGPRSSGTRRAATPWTTRRSVACSAVEMARELGMSRVTTRRYLEYLVDAGLVGRQARYRRRSSGTRVHMAARPAPQPPARSALSGADRPRRARGFRCGAGRTETTFRSSGGGREAHVGEIEPDALADRRGPRDGAPRVHRPASLEPRDAAVRDPGDDRSGCAAGRGAGGALQRHCRERGLRQ